ncbi:hypothetical protein AOLI_G00075850 [Acnodon oligacanthus]
MLQTPQATLDFSLSLTWSESLVDITGARSCSSAGSYRRRGGAAKDLQQVQPASPPDKVVRSNTANYIELNISDSLSRSFK